MKIKLAKKTSEAGNEAAVKGFDFYVKSVKKAFPGWPDKAINMVAEWYYNEDAADDFSTIRAFASYIQSDLPDMLDSADDASYIRQVIADANQSDLPRKVRKALKNVFPSYKYHTRTVDDDYMCVEYLEDNLIPEDEYRAGLEKLEELLPGIIVSDGGWHNMRQIEFQCQF
jgi:uncharacterized protein Usg